MDECIRESRHLPHPVQPAFVAGVMLSGHPPKPASHTIGWRSVTQPPVATHTRVDAVVAPTKRHGAISNNQTQSCPTDISHRQPCGPFVDCQFATSRFQEIVCLPQSLPTHLEISLSATIIILFRIFSMAYQHNKIKGSSI